MSEKRLLNLTWKTTPFDPPDCPLCPLAHAPARLATWRHGPDQLAVCASLQGGEIPSCDFDDTDVERSTKEYEAALREGTLDLARPYVWADTFSQSDRFAEV